MNLNVTIILLRVTYDAISEKADTDSKYYVIIICKYHAVSVDYLILLPVAEQKNDEKRLVPLFIYLYLYNTQRTATGACGRGC
jgi:hypothetical protein